MKTTTKLTVCGLVLSTAVACAPTYDNQRHHMDYADKKMSYFDVMDTNQNGVLSLGEMRLFAEKKFYEADVNGDNVVTRNEYHDAKKRKMGKHHDGYDRNYSDRNATYHRQNQPAYNNNRAGMNHYDSTSANDGYYYNDDRNRWDRRYR